MYLRLQETKGLILQEPEHFVLLEHKESYLESTQWLWKRVLTT